MILYQRTFLLFFHDQNLHIHVLNKYVTDWSKDKEIKPQYK